MAATYSATFQVSAAGMAPLFYQWQRNGVNIAGATNAAYSILSTSPSDAGSFGVIVSNDLGSVTSSNAVLSVIAPYTIVTLAGRAGATGTNDGTGAMAYFDGPASTAVDAQGNVYVGDYSNHTIRTITTAGVVTTFAGAPGQPGSADGTGAAARFRNPIGVAVDTAGNVYVADSGNQTIRKITPGRQVTTLAGAAGAAGSRDGAGGAARFNGPDGIAADRNGNLYVTDSNNHLVRKVTPAGVVTTLAGLAGSSGIADGPGSAARFDNPCAVAVDSATNLYVTEWSSHTIRKLTLSGSDWLVTTLAGRGGVVGSADGVGGVARFNSPAGIAVDGIGNLYVADRLNLTIRRITPGGLTTTIMGLAAAPGDADATGSAARLGRPRGIAVDGAGRLYIADIINETIRVGSVAAGPPAILTPPQPRLISATYPVTFDVVANGALPLAYQWLKDGTAIPGATSASLHLASSGPGDAGVYTVAVINALGATESSGATLMVADPYSFVTLAGHVGTGTTDIDGYGSSAEFFGMGFPCVDSVGNVYVTEFYTVRKITAGGVVSAVAGASGESGSADGIGSTARFNSPRAIVADTNGNLYVADAGNLTIRKIALSGGSWTVSTIAGATGVAGNNDGLGGDARFGGPQGIALDNAGNLFVTDNASNTVRKLTPIGTQWVANTIAGLAGQSGSEDGVGNQARFSGPNGIAADAAGNLYVADAGNQTIRKIARNGPNWVVSTIAGLALQAGSADGAGPEARFNSPRGIAVDNVQNVYVADANNNTIRKLIPDVTGTNWTVITIGNVGSAAGSTDSVGANARFNLPHGIAVDSAGNVYVTDTSNFTLRLGYVATGANSAFLLVPATSDPYLAGMPPGSTASTDDRAPAQSPVQVTNLPITPGLILNFQVVGDTSHGGGFPLLDAEGGSIYQHAAGSENGVADVFMPIDALLGVFLDNSAPNRSAAPSGLNFTSAGSRSYPSLRPALKQPFFIGNGLTTNGIVKSVIVPPGATRLFLGIMDGFQWAGNFGMLRVAVATNEATTPAILVQPVSVSALPGTDVGFSVVASGAPPLAYYWHFDGASLPGATRPSLDFSNVQATNAGFYQVVVTNAFGSVTSSTVTLGVLGAPARFIGGPSGLFLRTDGFHLLLGGLTGQGSLVLETSTDLARWFPIFTNPPAFGTIEFVDPAASNVSSRYYRVRVGAP